MNCPILRINIRKWMNSPVHRCSVGRWLVLPLKGMNFWGLLTSVLAGDARLLDNYYARACNRRLQYIANDWPTATVVHITGATVFPVAVHYLWLQELFDIFSKICSSTKKKLLFFHTTVLPHFPSPSNVWRRTTELTSESPDLFCQSAPPSTWTGRHFTRPWRPSLSLRSTTWRWTLVRSSPSGKYG